MGISRDSVIQTNEEKGIFYIQVPLRLYANAEYKYATIVLKNKALILEGYAERHNK